MDYTIILLGLGVIALIFLSYFLAKRRALKCENCGSKNVIKTGNQKEIDKKNYYFSISPMPTKEYEYQCQDLRL